MTDQADFNALENELEAVRLRASEAREALEAQLERVRQRQAELRDQLDQPATTAGPPQLLGQLWTANLLVLIALFGVGQSALFYWVVDQRCATICAENSLEYANLVRRPGRGAKPLQGCACVGQPRPMCRETRRAGVQLCGDGIIFASWFYYTCLFVAAGVPLFGGAFAARAYLARPRERAS